MGAVPPTPPAWCAPLIPGASTAIEGANSWLDRFDGGQDHAAFAASYRVFETARRSNVFRTRHFVHNGHWMVDVAGRGDPPGQYEGDPRDVRTGDNWGGGLVRPEKTFPFEDGRLVIQFDVAAGMRAYNDAWPEIVVTTAATPTGVETDPIHAIGVFGGAPAVGCRLYSDRTSSCSAYDGSASGIDQGGRTFELSANRTEGAVSAIGGSPATAPDASAWRTCGRGEADTACRDRFTVEFTKNSVRLWAGQSPYMAHSGLPAEKQLPAGLLTDNVDVYFASWVYIGQPESERLHWGRIAVGPHWVHPTDLIRALLRRAGALALAPGPARAVEPLVGSGPAAGRRRRPCAFVSDRLAHDRASVRSGRMRPGGADRARRGSRRRSGTGRAPS